MDTQLDRTRLPKAALIDRVVLKSRDGLSKEHLDAFGRSHTSDYRETGTAVDVSLVAKDTQLSPNRRRQAVLPRDSLSQPAMRDREPEGIGTGGTPHDPTGASYTDSTDKQNPTRPKVLSKPD